MATDRVNITTAINRKYYVWFQLVYLAFTHSKGQDQAHAHLDSKYIVNGDIQGKCCYC